MASSSSKDVSPSSNLLPVEEFFFNLFGFDVAVTWCQNASTYAETYNGKPWKYLLIPHDAISENMTLKGLADRFTSP